MNSGGCKLSPRVPLGTRLRLGLGVCTLAWLSPLSCSAALALTGFSWEYFLNNSPAMEPLAHYGFWESLMLNTKPCPPPEGRTVPWSQAEPVPPVSTCESSSFSSL